MDTYNKSMSFQIVLVSWIKFNIVTQTIRYTLHTRCTTTWTYTKSQIYIIKQLLHNNPQIFLGSAWQRFVIRIQKYAKLISSAFVPEVRLATPLINCQALMRTKKQICCHKNMSKTRLVLTSIVVLEELVFQPKDISDLPTQKIVKAMKRCPLKWIILLTCF
jgi:hypothetical protein